MKKLLSFICVALIALTLNACSSIPDGAKKPVLEINSITLANQDNETGFSLNFSVMHHSLTPLKLKQINADIFINDKHASKYALDYNDSYLPNDKELSYTIFIPANLLSSTAKDAIANNPLLMVQVSAAITLVFSNDESAINFNPSTNFEGLVGHELQK